MTPARLIEIKALVLGAALVGAGGTAGPRAGAISQAGASTTT